MKNLPVIFFVLVSLLAIPIGIRAQAASASITGTVTDPQGAVVSGAVITVLNPATNVSRSIQSDDTGTYRLANLSPGIYEITVEKSGFRTTRYSDLELSVAQVLTLDVQLEVGAVAESVEVRGDEVVPIDLATAQLSNLVDLRRITDLPLLTRNPYELVLLSPGTIQSNTRLGGFAVNGSRERNNNFLLDGVDNNDTSVPGIAGGITSINPDSTQEFRVITNNFLPEYGRNTGAVIDIITKSGANDIHGTLYWFGRWDETTARDFFNPPPDPENPFIRNLFGVSVGGPIKKDKTFWFFNYDVSRYRTTLTTQAIVPTAAFKTGVFTFGGTPIDVSTPGSPDNINGLPLDPTVQAILNLYPVPNGPAVDDVRGILFFPQTSRSDGDNITVRVDHSFSQNHILSGRYIFNRFEDPNPFFLEEIPGIGGVSTLGRTQNFSAALTSIFRPTLINEFRFGMNRTNLPFNCTGLDVIESLVGPKDPVGRGRDFLFPGIADFACFALGDSDGQARFTGTYTYRDTLTWIHGRHTVKGGVEFRDVYENGFNSFFSRSTPNFSNFANFGAPSIPSGPTTLQDMVWALFGFPFFETQSQFFAADGTRTADDARGFLQREFDWFVQDSFKVTPYFTLNFGVRWEWKGVPFEKNGNLSALFANPSGFAPFTFTVLGSGTNQQLYDDDWNNIQPRIGIAWDPFKKGKTSIRAGYGIFHDRVFGNLVGNARGNPPFQQDFFDFVLADVTSTPPPATLIPDAVVNDGDGIFPVLFDQRLRTPYSQNWNVGIQHELFPNLLVEANYVGAKGTKIFQVVDGNPPQPDLVQALIAAGVPESDLQFTNLYFGFEFGLLPFNAVNNNAFFNAALNTAQARSTYHALQVNVTKRFSHGFQMQGAYTWAHAIDNASDPLDAAAGNRNFPRNSFALFRERGNSDFDVRQRLVLNWIWELPFGKGRAYGSEGALGKFLEGWQVSGIAAFAEGIPYDIFGNVDNQHTSLSDRADLVGDPSIPSGADSTQTGPPVSAFDFAPFGRAANLGRNVFVGPGVNNWDLVLAKITSIGERVRVEFRTEVFNLANRVQFGQPGNLIHDPGTFGVSTSQVGRPDGTTGARQFQFGLKVHF
jgi:hypothetical protein